MSQTPERSDIAMSLGQITPTPGALSQAAAVLADLTHQQASFAAFRCSHCGSEEIQKLSVVYETGTSVIDARTRGSSTGIGMARGGLGIGTSFNSSRTRGTQTSELAKRAAPPAAKAVIGWVVLGVIVLALLGSTSMLGLALLIAGGCGFLAYRGSTYNNGPRQALLEGWNESWLCHRCGQISRIGRS